MDDSHFDNLARAFSAVQTRRGIAALLATAGAFPLFGLAEIDAKKNKKKKKKRKKRKKKKKCKQRGGKLCNGTCIPRANCCKPAECGAGATCQNGRCITPTTSTTPAPNPCAGVADGPAAACGAVHACGTPIGICGKACSGEVCAEIPSCKEPGDPCGANCCDPAGVACDNFPAGLCGCSSVDLPCFSSDGCCGPGICVGFVCRLP